ncbi:MAG TPA: hypothetical protein IAA77_07020 [Candidatus Avibacteroides excrementipullorum]|jgi:hypothetical protein|nr:hypothetical protein [Candidatus Avibacteroides excrementipullorum]
MKKVYLSLVTLIVFVLASCGKMGELSPEYFKTNPEVLEAVGGKVPVTITATFPEKYMKKKAVVEVIPVLKWNGGEAVAASKTFQGEKVEGNNTEVGYKAGGTYTMNAVFDYVPEMAKSELYLRFNAKVGKKNVKIPEVKIADGVISTSELLSEALQNANTATGEDKYQRIHQAKKEAQIKFLIQQANIRASELKSEGIKEFNEQVKDVDADKKGKAMKNIEISAYASPDGGFELNDKLADKRKENTVSYLNKELKKAEIETNVDAGYTAQDWEGFRELVAASNIQDKEQILNVLSMYDDPEQREAAIKNISSVYKTLADEILPELRRARLTLNYELIGRSDEEIMDAFKNDPSVLTVEELLYAATLTDNAAEKEAIYSKTTQLFPNDYRAYNNLGELAYAKADYDTADKYFAKAASIKDAPEVNMNRGLVALVNGDKESAQVYFGKASGAKELNESLGNLSIMTGEYDKAVNQLGDAKTNSAALAQILQKDYTKAKNTLDNVENPDATTSYLKAVLGARTNNETMVISNLKDAIAKDASYAKHAATDMEFAKYFNNSEFQALVK